MPTGATVGLGAGFGFGIPDGGIVRRELGSTFGGSRTSARLPKLGEPMPLVRSYCGVAGYLPLGLFGVPQMDNGSKQLSPAVTSWNAAAQRALLFRST